MSNAVLGGAGNGGGGEAARTPITSPDSIRSKGVLELVEEWCWGEIEGFAKDHPLKCVELNGTQVMADDGNINLPGVTFDYRFGTQSQSYIPGTVDDAIGTPVSVNTPVVQATPIIVSINDPSADAVRVILTWAGLRRQDPITGDTLGTTVQVQIDVKPAGGSWIPANLQGRGTVSDKQDGVYQRAFVINLRAIDSVAESWDIRVTRLTPDQDSSTINAFKFDTYVILTYAKLRRPNIAHCRLTFDTKYFSSIPTRSYNLLGWKCYVPHAPVYNALARTYTGTDWDGTLARSFTRNPAWFLYTLLLTEGHGLGDHIEAAYQDKWLIYQIAQRCDQLVDDGFGGQDFRYSIDAWISEGVPAHEMITQLANIFDAQALWDGTQVYLTQDSPKLPRSLYLPANVHKGFFTYAGSSKQVRYTAAEIKYNDITDQSRLTQEYLEDLEGIIRYGYNLKSETKLGCTSRAEAYRSGKRLLSTGRLETDSITFSPSLAAFGDKPGDIIRVADPKRQQGKRLGGRISTGSTTTVVVLDSPVVLVSGPAYRLAIIDLDGAVLDKAITNGSGTHSTLTVSSAFPSAPLQEMEWILYDPAAIAQLWRIVTIEENQDISKGAYNISAVQYNPLKYTEIDAAQLFQNIPSNLYRDPTVSPPSVMTINSGVYLAIEGIRRYLDISWARSTDPKLRGYALVVRQEGALQFEGEVDSQSKRILNPTQGTWEVTLAAVNVFGKFSSSITVSYELGPLYLVESVSITNLVLIGGGLEFSGRSVELDWDTDALTVLGFSDTYGEGPGGQSPWFRDYQIDIYNGVTLLRSDFVTESKYTYTYDKNLEDGGPKRTVKAIVRARDMNGIYSQSAQITVTNPAPLAINTVNVYAGFKSLVIKYIRPSDNDWVGVIVFLSTTTGFTPDALNMIYLGTDTTITIPDLLEDTPYFIRIAAYDAFGGESDYTLTGDEYTKTIASVSLPSPEQIKDGLQTALDTAISPLVFNADVFAVNLNGIDKTPFIIGVYEGNPAVLLDADVVVTGTLSADQLIGGRIAATEDIIIGEGAASINGDGSILVYNGNDTIANRDFALLSGGALTFQRYRGGEYLEYKAVRRVEYGQAPSGSTVELPGYWDAQPRIIVTPASLRSYDATYPSSSQTWTVRADNLEEIPETGTVLVDTQIDLVLQGSLNATIGPDYASKASGTDGWDTQVYSTIGTDQDCWVSGKFDNITTFAQISLNTDPQTDAGDLTHDFAIRSSNTGDFKVFESGVDRGVFGTHTASDTFKIERIGTQINYQKNGVTFRSAIITAGAILYVDSSFYNVGSGLNSLQFWHKQAPVGSGSGRYTFEAVAELNYSSSAGTSIPASNSGNLSVNGWYSGESILPNGTVSVTVSVNFSSIMGDGVSTYGYYYRTVSWTVQGWNGSAWTNLATKARAIAAAEHGTQITDTNPINIAAGITKLRVYFAAGNTNATTYSRGVDVYNYSQAAIPVEPNTGTGFGGGVTTSSTVTTPAWSVPGGWNVYAMRYTSHWGAAPSTPLSSGSWNIRVYGAGTQYVYQASISYGSQGDVDTGLIAASSYNQTFWSFTATDGYVNPTSITAYLNQLITNSTTVSNNFTFQSYAWNIAGSTAIATGSLNWMAIGD